MLDIRESQAKSILSPTSGFIKEAGFTHSLTPARNCTYGCTYCYVPTMGIYGGLKSEDWLHWGQFTTLKTNAAELANRQLRAEQVIYCSPLVDPYQPAEGAHPLMPAILHSVLRHPPKIFVIQTRSPLITRDLPLLLEVASVTRLRISFSITTDRDDVRRRYEPHCEPIAERLTAITKLAGAGLEVFATLAPLLPCNPTNLAGIAIEATANDLIGDPLHTRSTKARGATTRTAAMHIAERFGELDWFDSLFQQGIVSVIERAAHNAGRELGVGVSGFGRLATSDARR